MKISLLLDFYGSLLTRKQAQAIELYYNDDLSLSEVAEELAITRQGARDIISRGCDFLMNYENSLGLLAEFTRLKNGMKSIEENARKIKEISPDSTISELSREIIKTVSELEES